MLTINPVITKSHKSESTVISGFYITLQFCLLSSLIFGLNFRIPHSYRDIISIHWRGDRVVEGAALEKRWAMSPVGSNPTLSAERHGEVLEWTIRRAWRARVAQATVGSNPTLSAIKTYI